MFRLHVKPSVPPMSWQDFIASAPSSSVALDGYVKEGPRFNPTGPWANFNHHEEVSRLETRATCAQVLIAIRLGFYDTFKNLSGGIELNVFVNDCDEDVCLAVFILKNPHLALGSMNPALNRLVQMEDMLDTTAGAYPFPHELSTLKQLMWVFQPYHLFRVSGQLDKRNDVAFRAIIDDVGRRIMSHIIGGSEEVELDTRYEIIGGGKNWSLVREIGTNARIELSSKGIRAFVSVRERGDRYVYSIGRVSQFIRFPIPKIIKALNEKEREVRLLLGIEWSPLDIWGGSDIIAGSPRNSGSVLTPAIITEVIESVLRESMK